jgi:hypothetical protein
MEHLQQLQEYRNSCVIHRKYSLNKKKYLKCAARKPHRINYVDHEFLQMLRTTIGREQQ